MVLINNSAFADFRGKVNGLGQVLAAVGRSIGPSCASSLFAWSISDNHPFPFNSGFTYYISFDTTWAFPSPQILGICMFASSCLIYLLPKSINDPLGRIRDVYSDNEVEMKEVQKEPEDVVISVNPETAKQLDNPETAKQPDAIVVSEKKESATEAIPSANEVTAPAEAKSAAAPVSASNENEATQDKPRDSSVPSGVASQ